MPWEGSEFPPKVGHIGPRSQMLDCVRQLVVEVDRKLHHHNDQGRRAAREIGAEPHMFQPGTDRVVERLLARREQRHSGRERTSCGIENEGDKKPRLRIA